MRPSMYALLVIAAVVTGCVGPYGQALDPQYARLPDKELWFSMRLVGAFNELRCQGLKPEQAKAAYEMRFAARERAIDAAMLAKYGPLKEGEGEFLPMAKSVQLIGVPFADPKPFGQSWSGALDWPVQPPFVRHPRRPTEWLQLGRKQPLDSANTLLRHPGLVPGSTVQHASPSRV